MDKKASIKQYVGPAIAYINHGKVVFVIDTLDRDKTIRIRNTAG